MSIEDFIVEQARKHQRFGAFLTRVARKSFPQHVIVLEYPVDSKPRWELATPNPFLYELINAGRARYAERLQSLVGFAEWFKGIAAQVLPGSNPTEPTWINGWLPALDSVALYGTLALGNPKHYLEVGSGNSTKFARRAIADHGLRTQIISIDPSPRAEIDTICDRVVRQPVERVALETFDILAPGDILFIDCSHRVFMNSDATILFLDVIPRLKPGVLVQVHDITLPYDYSAQWVERYYSEQYLLAAYLLAQGSKVEIVLPNAFISDDPELKRILSPLWAVEGMKNAERYGGSFWIRTA